MFTEGKYDIFHIKTLVTLIIDFVTTQRDLGIIVGQCFFKDIQPH